MVALNCISLAKIKLHFPELPPYMALSKDWSIFAQDLESKSGVTVIFCYSLKTEERSSAAHTHWQ